MHQSNPKATVACCLLAALFTSSELAADSYRCGRKLIRTGDPSANVLRLCGEPRFRDRGHEKIRHEGKISRLPVQRWYYQKSERSLGRIVMIYQGRVVAIEVGRR